MFEDAADSRVLKPREIPKLGGSVAGFIALIVVLCIVIIISLIAIFLLLRDDGTSDEDDEEKLQRRPKSSTYTTPFEDEAESYSWFRRTYQRLPFVRTGSVDRVPAIKLPRPSSIGEASAPSGEDLQAELRDELRLEVPQPRYISRRPEFERLGLHSSMSTVPSLRRLSTPTTSIGSVRFETSGVRETYLYERERFAPSPATTLPTIYTQFSSPTSTRASSPIPPSRRSRSRIIPQEIPSVILSASVRHSQDITQHPALSSSPLPSPTTFEGGTKFLEAF